MSFPRFQSVALPNSAGGLNAVDHEPAVMARVLAVLHLIGATLATAWLVLPHSGKASELGVAACIVAAFAIGAGLVLAASRLSLTALQAITAFTIAVVISGAILATDATGSAFALFYLWATLYVFYFFSAAVAAAETALLAVAYGVVLLLGPSANVWGEEAARWGLTVATVVVSGGLVRMLTNGVRRSERRFRRGLDSSSLGIAILDASGRFETVNPALCELLGRDAAGLTLLEVTAVDDRPAVQAALTRVIEGLARSLQLEQACLCGDGRVAEVVLTLSGLSDERSPSALVHVQDVTERRRAERLVRHQADHDPLTDAFNRRRLEAELDREIRTSDLTEAPCAVLVADIDDLKYVNDSFGHGAGDTLLRQAAEALRERLRADDVLARIGGDEFAIVLPGADTETASLVARALLEHLSGSVRSGLRRTTASIGISNWDREHCATGEEMLVAADIAMYEAKESGRNRVAVASGARRAVTWVEDIRRAIDSDRLVLYAQPILDLASGRVEQEELLVRIDDGAGGIIPPNDFIPVAERFGLIHEIDRWVVGQAVELARGGRRVEVNLSAHSLGDRRIAEIVAGALAGGMRGENLIFEITETAAAANFDDAREFATRLGGLGCGFALDDFGTGFGAFTYLKHVQTDYLKIDIEFVRDLADSRADQRVVQSIVSIADAFGQRTIAEGVEDLAVLSLLREYGVSYAQGYAIGRPAPVRETLGLQLPGAGRQAAV